ncbi:hypothetical protein Back11_18030 [Paenibacillus baekrokdamisoli]|uniref:Uncharacterized protein n=1 Tax=Paenibacillus baekrokdamisoli TaxID=1712516 RepID=A0A3G9J9B3_9BACL|nr:hypothetical protein [Paenibacillus baekrokdamisoli]BBH20458.1 hypothetical protein Back11_18030 [Paenibacillus baekrokdamisoli]
MDIDLILFFVVLLVIIIVILVFAMNYKSFGSKYNRSYVTEISIKEIKAYYFKKQYCKECNQRLVRAKEKEFIVEGWDSINGTHFYGKKYRVIIFLKCPICMKKYKLEDL